MPKWRWLLRWPALLLGLGSLVLAFVARESGEAFVAAIPELEKIIELHEERGKLLFWFCLIFLAVGDRGVPVARRPVRSWPAERVPRQPRANRWRLVVSAAVVVIGVLVIWQTIRTGDAGAKAVWDGQLPLSSSR